ncbi:MAG: SDR family oxidoreductase [Novosphingobium sp.]|nr:SDR family oxidoreductase [Novosphingobium sp.]
MNVLSGKVALVTGSGRGIGREIALRLAKDGASIVAHYSGSKSGADAVVSEIEGSGGRAIACQADISKRDQVARMFEAIDREFGSLDVVVNNAGAMTIAQLAEVTDDQIEMVFGINAFGPLYVASEASKRLGDGGRIINLGSSNAKFPVGGAGLYGAAKAALENFTESWARELGARNITVNTVTPGATSPGMMDASPEYRGFMEQASPFKRIGHASEIAEVVAFLASPSASWVSGANILANGAASA